MNRIAFITAAVIAVLFAAMPAAAGHSIPRWIPAANGLVLDRAFSGARPIRTHYLFYARKIVVVFEFSRPAICGACSAPSNAMLPRGRVVRLSYDRKTHAITGAYQFCRVRGDSPPLAACLRR